MTQASLKPLERRRPPSVLPGFGLTLGYTLTYLSLLILIPLAALLIKASSAGWTKIWDVLNNERTIAAFELTVGAAFIAALINLFFGFLLAWVLTRYRFPGRSIMDAVVDLPFAMPTAVSGIALAAVYDSQTGWIGRYLAMVGIEGSYSRLGVTIALTFIGLPFVVRMVQPALADLDREVEEAAHSLGASAWTTFWRVLLPPLLPAAITGFALAFARALGEYGSVIFIASNIPSKTEIVPLLIIIRLDEFDYAGAAILGSAMLVLSFVLLLTINGLQWWTGRQRRERN
ncbi:MAG: sulfate ABC transporter permease subunit CysT [Phycisphaerae bacterium]